MKSATMSRSVEKTDGAAVVSVSSNPMNVVNEGVFSDLREAFDELPALSFSKRALRLAAAEKTRKERSGTDGEFPRVLRGRRTAENPGRALANPGGKRK